MEENLKMKNSVYWIECEGKERLRDWEFKRKMWIGLGHSDVASLTIVDGLIIL